jgi:hypothetical protein
MGESLEKALRKWMPGEKMKEAAKNNIQRIDCQLAVYFFLSKSFYFLLLRLYQ